MIGTHTFSRISSFAHRTDDKKEYPFSFDVRWGAKLKDFLNPFSKQFMTAKLNGIVDVGGIGRFPCVGTLKLDYVNKNKITYEFLFVISHREYKYVGEKVNIKPWNLPASHTTCFGTIIEKYSGTLVSKSITHFRMSTLPSFLKSFTLTNKG
jgi:hypothetical protein